MNTATFTKQYDKAVLAARDMDMRANAYRHVATAWAKIEGSSDLADEAIYDLEIRAAEYHKQGHTAAALICEDGAAMIRTLRS